MSSQVHTVRGLLRRACAPLARMSQTRANHVGGLLADVLVAVTLVLVGLERGRGHAGWSLGAFCLGLVLFSWVEYGFHRWLMHGRVPLFEPGHRKHHEQPLGHDSLPFFLPPLIVCAMAAGFSLVLPPGPALLLAAGLACGYVAYGLGHVLIHATRFRHPLARRWAAAHHVHHHHPDANFGVTSPLWDIVLGTRYPTRGRPGRRR